MYTVYSRVQEAADIVVSVMTNVFMRLSELMPASKPDHYMSRT